MDFVNETNENELNGLSGMLITALEQSRRLSVLSRSRMFDILRDMGMAETNLIDEALARKICSRAHIKTMAIASIKKFGRVYTIDLKLLDFNTGEYIFTDSERGTGEESVPDLIDRLAASTRKALKEREADIAAASQQVSIVTTSNLEAWQQYFVGEQLNYKGDFDDAKTRFMKAIALDSTFGLAYYGLAWAVGWGLTNEQKAREPILKAMRLLNRFPEKERYLVRALAASIDYSKSGLEEAIAILKEMEQFFPDDKRMMYYIGDCYVHLCESYSTDQYESAKQYLNRVIEVDPKFTVAWDHLGRAFVAQKKYSEGIDVFRKGLKENPGSLVILVSMGWALHQQHKYPEAEGVFRKALELVPSDASNETAFILQGLGWALYFERKYASAEEMFQKANSLSPGQFPILNGLIQTSIVRKDYSAAMHYAHDDRISSTFSDWVDFEEGQIALLQRNYKLAEERLQDCLKHPKLPKIADGADKLLGYTFSEQGRFTEAESHAEKALEADSNFLTNNLMAWILVAGDINLARGIDLAEKAVLAKAEDDNPAYDPKICSYLPLPEHTLGLAYLKKGEYEKAIHYLQMATKLLPERRVIVDHLQQAKEKLERGREGM